MGFTLFIGCTPTHSEGFFNIASFGAKQLLKLDAEKAHNIAVMLAKYKLVPHDSNEVDPILKSKVWGLNFKNPVRNYVSV